MPILALDTSTLVSSVAVADTDKLLAELTLETRLTHSETLMPHIEQVLAMADIDKTKLAGVAVSIGPGSYTGLRIGLASAKGMAYALDIPLIGVPTMEALACQCPVPGIYAVPLIDAQKGNAYMAVYRWEDGQLVEQQAVEVLSVDDCLARCAALDRPVILLGDAAVKKVAGRKELPQGVQIALPHIVMPRAAGTALLGLRRLAAGQAGSVMDMEPVYIRRSEAEVLWEKRHKEQL